MRCNSNDQVKKSKILCITHDVGAYGASRSLQLLLNRLEGFEIDLVVPRYVFSFRRMLENKKFFREQDEADIRRKFGSHIGSVHQVIMDCDWLCFEASHFKKKKNIYTILEFIFSTTDTWYLKYLIWKNQYEFIHLNSTVLHRYATLGREVKTLIHIREDVKQPNPKDFIHDYKLCHGAIFIDRTAYLSLECADSIPNRVLMNPFDMTDVYDYGIPDIGIEFDNKIVFAMFGQINETKGIDFVIEGFVKANLPNTVLLIVGSGSREYIDVCRIKIADNENIFFLPEEQQIKKYYAITDYVIRGESYLGLGRTIYEALYSGCGVIVPGKEEEFAEMFFEYQIFCEKVIAYTARDIDAFVVAIKRADTKKDANFQLLSNCETYVEQFKDFLQKVP